MQDDYVYDDSGTMIVTNAARCVCRRHGAGLLTILAWRWRMAERDRTPFCVHLYSWRVQAAEGKHQFYIVAKMSLFQLALIGIK